MQQDKKTYSTDSDLPGYVALHGAETVAFEMTCCRRMLRVSWRQHRINSCILEEVEVYESITYEYMQEAPIFLNSVRALYAPESYMKQEEDLVDVGRTTSRIGLICQ